MPDGQEFKDALLDLLQPIMVFVQNFLGARDIPDLFGTLLPRYRQQPIQIVARDGGLGRHGWHSLELLQFLHGLVFDFFRHAGGFDLLLQLVELALLATAQFLLNGLDLFVEVILFLGALHLALYTRLDSAVHVELLDLDIEDIADAIQPLGGVKNLQQFLLFFNRELQVGRDRVGELGRVLHADRGNHGLVVQRLAQLDILLEQGCDPLHASFELRVWLRRVAHRPNGGLHEAFGFGDLQDFTALHTFDQNLDIPVGEL